jgi:N-acetylmuramoyl-L-alanine amidase
MKAFFLLITTFFFSFWASSAKSKITLVIDPGHGGSDHGYVSSCKDHLTEKELNLIIAKKFGEMIERELQNVTILYTRSDDTYPSLNDRVRFANNSKADYFISIHCNASTKKSVFGTESHVHTMDGTKSVGLAQSMEKEFVSFGGRFSRGVKDTEDREHSLHVLKYTTMTGVLIECGFLTNEDEAIFLNSVTGQETLAKSIFRAFKGYIQKQHPSINFEKEGAKQDFLTSSSGSTNGSVSSTKSSSLGYSIQIMSSKQPIDTLLPEFKKIELPVVRNEIVTESVYRYKYTVGSYSSQDEAKRDLEKIQQKGFRDAYVVKMN